jgi:hypothetical protein
MEGLRAGLYEMGNLQFFGLIIDPDLLYKTRGVWIFSKYYAQLLGQRKCFCSQLEL